MTNPAPEANPSIDGTLVEFREMGRGTPIWSINDGKQQNTYPLKDGDLLTVFNDASRTSVLWQGEIKLVPTGSHWPSAVDGQEGVSRKDWEEMFYSQKPATLKPKNKPQRLTW